MLVYNRAPGATARLGIQTGWKYEYAPEGRAAGRLNWPWSKPDATPAPEPDDTRRVTALRRTAHTRRANTRHAHA